MKIEKYPKYDQNIFTTTINNLRVVCIPNNKFKTTSVCLFVNYGATDINYKLNGKEITSPLGSAHFLEHKIFELKDEEDAFQKMCSLGADANAYTSYDETCYTFNTSINFYETLDVFLEYIFTNTFNNKTIDKEKGIIIEELMMYLDKPHYQVQEKILKNLYSNSYIKDPILGTKESISNTNENDLTNVYEAFYQPSNMVLNITGNVDPDELEKYLNNYLCKLSLPNNEVERITHNEPNGVNKQFEEIEIDSKVNYVALGIKLNKDKFENFQKNDFIIDAFTFMLFSKATYKINQLIQNEVLYSGFNYSHVLNPNFCFIEFIAMSDKKEELIENLKDIIFNFEFNDEDFDLYKKVTYAEYVHTFDNLDNLSYEVTVSQIYNYNYFDFNKVLQSITKEDIVNFAKEINEDMLSIVVSKNMN